MAQQLSIPKGTRDFGPDEMVRRNYIFNTIKAVFHTYGYSPIETPAMENLSTLLGKYGDEGDKLLFKILNSGNYLDKIGPGGMNPEDLNKITGLISEKGLRYDLTVPFARFVVQHRNEIQFPFKRYQIQPVWRADKPQKGRYREFYQCDVDVVGSDSLLNEFELIQIIDDVFGKLKVNVTVKINNRKILYGIAEAIGFPDKFMTITVAIDKLEKIGEGKVIEELRENGLNEEAIEKIRPILSLPKDINKSIPVMEKLFSGSETGRTGISEIRTIFNYIAKGDVKIKVELDLTLARGLNYYTGAIFEVKADDVEIGSICGGGRYDNLTGIFGLKDVSGVGISFGADRIYDVMTQLDIFPGKVQKPTEVLFVNFGEQEEELCLKLAKQLRNIGKNCEVYPQKAKFDKQFKYANNKNVSFVVIIGEEELKNNTISVKNMQSGEQTSIAIEKMMDFFTDNLK